MGLEIQPEIYKWLQNMKLVKEAKRAEGGKIQLPESVSAHFFDGLFISHIAKPILEHRQESEAAKRLAAIKENSTPAIRLYNWNLLGEAMKKLGYHIDYSQKSRLLNLESQAMLKIIKHLWTIRLQSNPQPGKLGINTTDMAGKKIGQAANVFQFLVILICEHFKLSGQHALNLFLDGNKYLAHLLVKGVKGSYDPVLNLVTEAKKELKFLVDSLFCLDEKENVDLFLGALKPCLISKDQAVAATFLTLLQQLIELYQSRSLQTHNLVSWMIQDGLDTIFFSIKRHPSLFSQSLSVAYAFLNQTFFQKLFPEDKSLLWNNQIERLSFYRMFIIEGHPELLHKFTEHPVFDQWNLICLRSLKKSSTSQEKYSLMVIFQTIWHRYPQRFEKNALELPSAYASFLKACAGSAEEVVFIEAIRVLFALMVQLGTEKNPHAPVIYKTAVAALGSQQDMQRIDWILEHFLEVMKEIPSLPASPLAEHILKFMDKGPSGNMIEMAKIILSEERAKEYQKEDIQESLLKVIFSDITYSTMAQDILIGHLSQTSNTQSLIEYSTTALAQFYSVSQHVTRSMKELKMDFERYSQEENMKKGEPAFLRNLQKFLNLSNIICFLEKAIFKNSTCKEDIEPHIFHTYIRIEKELRKEHISRLLLPLLRTYYDQFELPRKLEEYIEDIRPPILNFESIGHSQEISPAHSPSHSGRPRRKKEKNMKTEESMQKGMQSIMKDLEQIKKRREEERQRSLMEQKERQAAQQKKLLFYSMINEKRKVEHGNAREVDLDYKYLLEFDSVKSPGHYLGNLDLSLLNLQQDEEVPYVEDASNVLKKYRKIWRFLFFKYSSFGLKGKAEGQIPEQKINGADILRLFKDYDLNLLNKEKVLSLVKKVNQHLKRKNDPSNLSYLGFQEYILQYCFLGYRRQFPQNPPGRQVLKFIEHLRSVTASKGTSVEMFDNPDEMYFQETEVIREFNRRLSENPDYPLPEGYKKVRQAELSFHYSLTQFQKGIKPSRQAAIEVLDEILYSSLGLRVLQPVTNRQERCLARPVLFQKIKDKIKDYSGGYLMPKRSAYLPRIEKECSPAKPQFHGYINFSLGIRLGIAGTDLRVRMVAEEVAYWLDDALDAIDAGSLKVGNKSKSRVQNELIRRKRSEAVQFRIEKQEQDRRERARAQTLKNQTEKFREDLKQKEKRSREEMKLQRRKRKEREDLMLQKKRAQFQEAKSKLDQKRRAIEEQKSAELVVRKKEKEDYRRGVNEYFQKKKEELEEKEKAIKANKDHQDQAKKEKKSREEKKKRELEIQIFKKEETVLQKLTQTKQTYDEVWKSPEIQSVILNYRAGLKLMFDLLLKYEKSKISTTAQAEVGLGTINFYLLKSKVTPLLVSKTGIALLFRATLKKAAIKGIDFPHFQELLFKIACKGKQVLNSHSPEPEGDGDDEVEEGGLPSYQSSPGMESPSKQTITDEYTVDASGVTESTVRRIMEFLELPSDKGEAEQKFREYLESKGAKPVSVVLKEARSHLASMVGD